jgi:integrase
MGRPRSARKRYLPANLYERGGYFSWRHPETGVEFGIGRDKSLAINQALEANTHLLGAADQIRLIHRMSGDAAGETVADWVEKFHVEIVPTRNYKKNSLYAIKSKGKAVKESALGGVLMRQLTVRHVSEFLDEYLKSGRHTWAALLRQYLVDLLDCACQKGWLEFNPTRTTAKIATKVSRNRLRSLDDFLRIYEAAADGPPWLQRAMELALVTGQRRIDLCKMEFRPRPGATAWVADGYLWVIQSKVKGDAEPVKLKFPLSLRLEATEWSLEEIIARCRDSTVSPYLVHRPPERKRRKPGQRRAGAAVHEDAITREFSNARDRCGLVWPDRDKNGRPLTPPTFHEIRSLAVRLYQEQGLNIERVRQRANSGADIAGHKDPKMTGLHLDPRAEEWLEIVA